MSRQLFPPDQFVPGPGYYPISGQYIQQDQQQQQSYIFTSSTQRSKPFILPNPGPGSYNSPLRWGSPSRKKAISKKFTQEIVEEQNEEEMLTKAVFYDLQQVQKKIQQDIGPSDYKPEYNQVKKRTYGAIISKESKKMQKEYKDALIEHQDKLQQLQLMQKHDPEKDISRIKKDWINRKKNQAIRTEKQVKVMDKCLVPDPGYYFNPSRDTDFKTANKKQMSAFTSNSRRFQENVSNTPVPYDVQVVSSVGFAMNKQSRFKVLSEHVPAPGQYEVAYFNQDKFNIENELEKDVKKEMHKKTAAIFGSSLIRFPKQHIDEIPGPGTYIKDKKKKKKKTRIQKINMKAEYKDLDDYETEIQKIQINLANDIKQNVIKKEAYKTTIGFLTNTKRFNGNLLNLAQKIDFNVDPGQYENQKRPDLDKYQFNKYQQDFSRVKYFKQDKRRFVKNITSTDEELGPGSYDLPQRRLLSQNGRRS